MVIYIFNHMQFFLSYRPPPPPLSNHRPRGVVPLALGNNGLNEPIGPLIRTKNPEDFNEALHILTNYFQFYTEGRAKQYGRIQRQNHQKF